MRWWDDLWLNESFATFMSQMALVRATRFTGAWTSFCHNWKTWAYRQDQLPSTHPVTADIRDIESVKVNFDGITYAKGASVLRQMLAWVGEEAFLEGVAEYFRRHQFANTTLQDFLAPLERRSGRDLRAWSKEWLETAGVNTLRPRFSTQRSGGEEVFRSFVLTQEAPPGRPALRSHRVAVGLYDAGDGELVRRRRVEVDLVGDATEVPELAGEIVPELLLVNDDDLTYAKLRLDERSLATAHARLHTLSDPLARALVWSAAWDMVRDAEMAASAYLRLVLAHAHREADVDALQTLLGQAAAAVHFFCDPAGSGDALLRLAGESLRRLNEAAPGGDLQLAWARGFISSARSAEHLGAAQDLLDGAWRPSGLEVGTDLRWLIVNSLAAAGEAGEELVAAEERHDPTDAGARQAAAARSARPAPEAKEEAWRAVTEDSSQPLATMKAIMGGFQQPGQAELLEPYAERFFASLEPLWTSRNVEVALAFAEAMYPRLVIDEGVIRLTEAYLGSESPAVPIRRLLLEGKDEMARALRARAKDAEAGT
ncbi:MAG: ERAP1-like C-terminal domain-containing protein, partial [Acidimicrobiales bacterium]